ncbi:MAG: hypothetical protein JXB85_14005 [Anaerolineales bacterium]|nr:hypothetical protein [Anaerolineales bacterium]
MISFTPWALRLLGISGILGSILFILGDLLYNHVPGSIDSPAVKMSTMPESRLLSAGTLGLIGCWLYTLASLHLFIAFQPAGVIFAILSWLAFAATLISYGISHTAYFAIAAGAQVATQLGSGPLSGGKLGNALFQRLVYITYLPAAVFSLMMIYGIVSGRSMYPRWMVAFLPTVLYLLKTPVTRILKGHLQEIIHDSYDNIVLFVFFVLSTIVLWNGLVP